MTHLDKPGASRTARLASLGIATLLCAVVAAAACTSHDSTIWIYPAASPWPTRSVLPPNPGGQMITTNNLDDTLSFVDLATLSTVATLPVGINPVELEGPHHLASSLDGKTLFVGLTETFPTNASGPHGSHGSGAVPGYLQKIRASDGALLGQVRIDRSPGDIVLSPDGTKVYASHFDIKRIIDQTAAGGTEASKYSGIAVVDATTMTREALVMVCPAEHGMTITPDGGTMYVACYGNDTLAVVDLSAATLPSTLIPAGPNPGELPGTQSYQPYAATLSSDGQTVWISCWGSGDIRPFRTATQQFDLAKIVSTGGYPAFGDTWGDRMIVARQSGTPGVFDDHLVVIGSSGTLVADYVYPPSQCKNAHAVHRIPGQPGKAVIVCEGDHANPGSLVRVDLATGVVEGTSQVGVFPDAVTFIPAGAP